MIELKAEGSRGYSSFAGEAAWREELEVLRSVVGLFSCYLLHDALQERAFRRPGFVFGWAMTAMEMGTMSFFAAVLESRKSNDRPSAKLDTRPQHFLLILILCIAVSQGTGTMALAYVNYPVKVAFKSSKLIPTMMFSRFLAAPTGKKYTLLEYAAALFMCISLTTLGLADVHSTTDTLPTRKMQVEARSKHLFGFWLLTIATCSDAIIPNLQDKLLRAFHLPTNQMVVLSNLGSFLLVLIFIVFTGEARAFFFYSLKEPFTLLLLVFQALSAYLGLRSYLALIKKLSGVGGVIATSARKVLTLILSFLLFKKPFTNAHAIAIFLLFIGVGLAILAKEQAKQLSSQQHDTATTMVKIHPEIDRKVEIYIEEIASDRQHHLHSDADVPLLSPSDNNSCIETVQNALLHTSNTYHRDNNRSDGTHHYRHGHR